MNVEKADYSFQVVGLRATLKTLEEQLLHAETAPTLENYERALNDVNKMWRHLEQLELVIQRRLGVG